MKKLLGVLLAVCMLVGVGMVGVLADGNKLHTLTLDTPQTVSGDDSDFQAGWIDFRFRPLESGDYTIHVEGNFDSLKFFLGDTSMDEVSIEVFDGLNGSWSVDYSMTAEKYFRFVIACATSDTYTVTITEAGQTDPEPKWWESLPSFLQILLRYIFFGWLWMN